MRYEQDKRVIKPHSSVDLNIVTEVTVRQRSYLQGILYQVKVMKYQDRMIRRGINLIDFVSSDRYASS